MQNSLTKNQMKYTNSIYQKTFITQREELNPYIKKKMFYRAKHIDTLARIRKYNVM